MRTNLKGIHSAHKKLANGSKRTYYYAWRGGPRLDGEPGSPEFMASYNKALAEREKPPEGCFFTLIAEYRGSAEYKKLRPSTTRDYDRYLKIIEEKWGRTPIAFISTPGFRGDLKSWRDKMSETPRKADLAWAVLARVLSVAKDRGRIKDNPAARGGRLYKADRVDAIWTKDTIDLARAKLPKDLSDAMMLALWTGQRQADVLTLPWSAIDGRFIRLKQAKGGRRVSVRIIAPLRRLLDEIQRRPPHKDKAGVVREKAKTILTNSRGEPWTSSGFRASWGKKIAEIGIAGLTFHDLRGSAITRLAEAGCTEAEITSITGHSPATVSAMLDRHYLSRTDALSDSAGQKLEDAEERNSRQTERQTEAEGVEFEPEAD